MNLWHQRTVMLPQIVTMLDPCQLFVRIVGLDFGVVKKLNAVSLAV
jgi:hypothetical protein